MDSEQDGFPAAVAATFDELARTESQRIVRVDAGRPAVAVSQEMGEIALQRLTAERPQVTVLSS
jgi:thymidylate kinase